MKNPVYSDEYSKIEIIDGIVHGTFLVEKINLEIVKNVVRERIKICGGVARPILIDMTRVKTASKEARDFLGSEEGSELLLASALVVETPLSSFLANFFTRINIIKPLIPLRVFPSRDKSKAITWLREYL